MYHIETLTLYQHGYKAKEEQIFTRKKLGGNLNIMVVVLLFYPLDGNEYQTDYTTNY